MGGALASITSIKLSKLGFKIGPLYTHGSPRTGDEEFSSELELLTKGHYYRIVNEDDMTSRVPPHPEAAYHARRLFFDPLGTKIAKWLNDLNYTHSGGLYQIKDNKIVKRDIARDDKDYWSKMNWVEFWSMIRYKTQAKRHHEGTYLCELYRIKMNLNDTR